LPITRILRILHDSRAFVGASAVSAKKVAKYGHAMDVRRHLYLLLLLAGSGCAPIPRVLHQPQYHNPFPQLHRVAILPFYNLSAEPTVDQDQVALAYFTEMQQIPGFEIMPPEVVKTALAAYRIEIDGRTDFQQLARMLGVDVVIRGAVTDFSPYYPPRIGLSVDWYAANPSFHPIPPGYGLPWGTPDEEFIPSSLVLEAEFALAREQLKTQTPEIPEQLDRNVRRASRIEPNRALANADASSVPDTVPGQPPGGDGAQPAIANPESLAATGGDLPPDWPDPRGFLPRPPSPTRPPFNPQLEPIVSHTRLYDASDERFTERLENYAQFRDDARYGDWQGYLARSGDFIRFCCHLHITETLAARGGVRETRVVWRWPIGRYELGTGRR
jgi:hypothetical protein